MNWPSVEELATEMLRIRTNAKGVTPNRGKALAWASAALKVLKDMEAAQNEAHEQHIASMCNYGVGVGKVE